MNVFEDNMNKTINAISYTYTLSPNKHMYSVLLNTESGDKYTYEEYNVNPDVDLTGSYDKKRILYVDCKNRSISYDE